MSLVFQAIFSLKMFPHTRRLATLLKPTTSFFSAKESAKPGNKTNITFLIQSLRREPSTTSLQTIFGRLLRRLYSVNPNPGNTMVVTHNVKGYDEFSKKMEELENGNGSVHVLFSGGKDENGLSWCPYCVKAEPVIHDALKKAPDNSHFVHVDVGERAYWKDLNCPFRKDPNTHLVFLPTLLRWKQPQRLDGERCSNKDLVEMMFEDED